MKMLRHVPQSLHLSDLSDEQNKQLSKWVGGLYATDENGETTGIGDEVMSQCPPQAFYMLVPILFDQSVLACRSNVLSIETMRGGLEFLLEPFLLPSLVGGISWLVKHSWEDHDDADILLQMLEKLLKPSGSSQDMQAMHRCILGIVCTPLVSSLQTLISRRPEKSDQANALIAILKPHMHQRRTMVVTRAELDGYSILTQAVKQTVRDLALWAVNGGNDAPPRYAPLLAHCAIKCHTSFKVLQAIVEELRDQTIIGNGSIALDVCVPLVCAPDPTSYTTIMHMGGTVPQITGRTLHDAIRLKMMEPQKLLEMPTADAEALVRLARRVEAQSAVSQVALVNMPSSTEEQAMADQVMQDLGLGTSDAPMAVGGGDSLLGGPDNGLNPGGNNNTDFTADFGADANTSLNMAGGSSNALNDMMQLDNNPSDIFGDINVDFGQGPQQGGHQAGVMNVGGSDQQNAEEDIFAGLDMGGLDQDFDFS
jgi:mediator of RNA polymerase II transcription subunit 5